jgi:transposase
VWIGDPAEIKTKRVKEQKTDLQDARLLLRLMREDNFPRIWVPDPENRDLRQLLWHRHRLVQMRTRIMNQLRALAINEGYRWKKKLFSEQGRAQLEKLTLAPWASRRQQGARERSSVLADFPHRRLFRASLTEQFKMQSHWDRDSFVRATMYLSD